MIEKIGFIGLGIMGEPMATNLLKGGYSLRVYDIRPDPVTGLSEEGAIGCQSIIETCTEVDVIITILPDSPDVELVYLGEGGILESAKTGTVLIDMSTIAPVTAIKVAETAAEKGCPMLDAPVSGGDVGAREGRLSIMVGGNADVYNKTVPIFEVLGNPILCGKNGAGQIVKACNQIQVALNLIGMAEALVLGAKAGVDPEIIVKVLSGGYAQSRVMDVRGPKIIERDFNPGFKSKFHYKDLNIIRETGREYNVPLPASALAHELYGAVVAAGRGEIDHSGVITIIEDLAGIEVQRNIF